MKICVKKPPEPDIQNMQLQMTTTTVAVNNILYETDSEIESYGSNKTQTSSSHEKIISNAGFNQNKSKLEINRPTKEVDESINKKKE